MTKENFVSQYNSFLILKRPSLWEDFQGVYIRVIIFKIKVVGVTKIISVPGGGLPIG